METNEPTPPQRTDQDNWSKPVDRLHRTDSPEGAVNLNVDGRRVVSPVQGFGKMWQKTYRVALTKTTATPKEIIQAWKQDFSKFWPAGNDFYAPLTGIAPGEVALLNLSMPGKLKLSTGVLVLYADEESFTLMTPQGHMFAGWITFSSFESEGVPVAQTQVLMRAQNPVSEIGLTLGGHGKEDKFWEHTLSEVAKHFGTSAPAVTTEVVCVDPKRQWSKAGNIWHDAAIRSGIYMMGAPFRWAAKPFRRKDTDA